MSAAEEIAQRWQPRRSLDLLPSHLEDAHGIRVAGVRELDLGVYRVDRHDGPSWVARLFPPVRPLDEVLADVDVLRFLARSGFSAERPAVAEPVSVLDGQGLLVTEFVDGVPPGQRRATARTLGGYGRLGAMLGRLHTLPGSDTAVVRTGGAWHHLAAGGPADEIAAAISLLAAAGDLVGADQEAAYQWLQAELADLDSCSGLPEALVHPDFVLPNVVVCPDRYVVVDWTGAGRGPRLWSLAFLLFSAGAGELRRVDAVVAGYLRHLHPEPEELARLDRVLRARPMILHTWAFCAGRATLTTAVAGVRETRDLADAIAVRARAAFAGRT